MSPRPVIHYPPQAPLVTDDELSDDENIDLAIALAEEFDDLGFALPLTSEEKYENPSRVYAQWFHPKAMRRQQRFEARRCRLSQPGEWTSLPRKLLKAMLRKGIPSERRREVWWNVLGCEARQQTSSGTYAKFVCAELPGRTATEIENDLARTFPNHAKFRTAAGRGELRNVLRAYASYSPEVQYCQGLNFIAALLIIVFLDEEQAFWALVCAIDSLGVQSYYMDGMTLLRVDMQVLSNVLAQKCPKVSNSFQKNNVELMPICAEWYLTWFSRCLPIPTVLRVWDTLFLEGFKVLFRIALGLFKRVENQVLQCDGFDAIMENSKYWPRCMVEHNELLKAGFRGVPALRRRDLIQARDTALNLISEEDEAQRRRLSARREGLKQEAAAREDALATSAPSSKELVEDDEFAKPVDPALLQTLEDFCDIPAVENHN